MVVTQLIVRGSKIYFHKTYCIKNATEDGDFVDTCKKWFSKSALKRMGFKCLFRYS